MTMMNKMAIYLALAIFALGMGIGLSTPAVADTTCHDDCRADRIECRHDCGYNPPEYQAFCFAQCDSNFNACWNSC
jgi:hypothetical protein